MIERVISDIRYAARTLTKSPTFTAAVVATIALAIGATTAIFAVVDSILLRPLPFPDSERVVALCETNPVVEDWCGASPMNVADWDRSSAGLEAAGVARTESFIARGDSGAYGVMGGIVTSGFFDALRVRPMLGRLIEEGDLPRGSNQVVVVSREFWQRRLGSDPSIVGRSVVLDQKPFTVVGVLPAGAWMPDPFGEVQVWKPLTASIDNVENRGWRGFTALGRMAPGVSRETLLSELAVIRSQLATAYPEANADWGLALVSLRDRTVGDIRSTLWTFLGTAVFVLLIACANVAGLFLVRATGRAAEFALRASLGAGRRRLVQQLLTESLVLSLAGGAVGLLLAVWITSGFVAVAPATIPRLAEVGIDARVVLFVFGLAVLVAMIFGIGPARRAMKADLNGPLKGVRSGHAGDTRLRAVFTVGQLALALMLLFGAGLLTRSFARLSRWEPGFDRGNVVTTWMLPPKAGDGRSVVPLMEQVRDEVAALPGVLSAGLGSAGPLFGGDAETGDLAIEGRPPFPADRMPSVQWFDIDRHYFDTLGIRTVKGRPFTAVDTSASPHVAIVTEAFARRFFPGEDAIGHRVTVQKHRAEIVGIVSDVRPLQPNQSPPPQIYWPIQQYPRGAAYLILRTAPEVAGIQKSVEMRVAAIDGNIQLNRFVTLDERLARWLVSPRFNMLLVIAFALVALLLAAVGVYGVIASSVASRTREFGIRVALGATPEQLVRNVVRGAMVLAFFGVAAGCTGGLAGGRLLASLLYGLPVTDLPTLAAAAAVLVLVAIVASWTPARRASRVDPVVALRAQ
jgi:predicted permease